AVHRQQTTLRSKGGGRRRSHNQREGRGQSHQQSAQGAGGGVQVSQGNGEGSFGRCRSRFRSILALPAPTLASQQYQQPFQSAQRCECRKNAVVARLRVGG